MKKIIILIITILPFFLFGQTDNDLQTIDKHIIYLDNSIIQRNDTIQKVIKKEVYFIGNFKTNAYTKPSPIEIEIMNYIGLKEKIGTKNYHQLNNTKATYSISQNDNLFQIRSLKLLKPMINKQIKFKAILYEIYTQNEHKNLIIIKRIITE